MHIAVIGAGLVGLTTAHALHKRNLQVTVFEAESAPGAVTSFANGAQLSYSYTDPMASPELLRSLPSILAGRAAGINIRHKADLDYLQWSAQFLWNCLPHRQRKNAAFLEQLAARSAQLMDEYHQNPALSYYHSSKGKLVLLDKKPGKRVVEGVHRKQQSGTDISILRRNQVLELVPQLNQWTSTFSYALFSNGDDVADPHEFSRSLSDYLAGSGVEFCFEQNVESLQSCSRGIDVHIDDRVRSFDATVVCTGNRTKALLTGTDNRSSIYPVAGYSISLPAGPDCPEPSITALADRIVLARLAKRVRIAGFADINPHPANLRNRLQELLDTARLIAPNAACYDDSERAEWVGYRPSTPGGPPDVGKTSVRGLFKNVGHGSLGWTLAAATAEIVSAAVVTEMN